MTPRALSAFVSRRLLSRAEALRDSTRPHIVFLRFTTISLVSALVDNLVFYLVFHATGTILGAQIAARCISVFVNYRLVRSLVFCSHHGHRIVLPRYLLLAGVNAAIAYAVIRLILAYTLVSVILAKIVAESLLFIANFIVQRTLVFPRGPLTDRASGL